MYKIIFGEKSRKKYFFLFLELSVMHYQGGFGQENCKPQLLKKYNFMTQKFWGLTRLSP